MAAIICSEMQGWSTGTCIEKITVCSERKKKGIICPCSMLLKLCSSSATVLKKKKTNHSSAELITARLLRTIMKLGSRGTMAC